MMISMLPAESTIQPLVEQPLHQFSSDEIWSNEEHVQLWINKLQHNGIIHTREVCSPKDSSMDNDVFLQVPEGDDELELGADARYYNQHSNSMCSPRLSPLIPLEEGEINKKESDVHSPVLTKDDSSDHNKSLRDANIMILEACKADHSTPIKKFTYVENNKERENGIHQIIESSSLMSFGSSFDNPSSLAAVLQPDPEDILLNLGFGGNDASLLQSIPSRFFQGPSTARGINVEEFHKSLLKSDETLSSCTDAPSFHQRFSDSTFSSESINILNAEHRRVLFRSTHRDIPSIHLSREGDRTPSPASVITSDSGNRNRLATLKEVPEPRSRASSFEEELSNEVAAAFSNALNKELSKVEENSWKNRESIRSEYKDDGLALAEIDNQEVSTHISDTYANLIVPFVLKRTDSDKSISSISTMVNHSSIDESTSENLSFNAAVFKPITDETTCYNDISVKDPICDEFEVLETASNHSANSKRSIFRRDSKNMNSLFQSQYKLMDDIDIVNVNSANDSDECIDEIKIRNKYNDLNNVADYDLEKNEIFEENKFDMNYIVDPSTDEVEKLDDVPESYNRLTNSDNQNLSNILEITHKINNSKISVDLHDDLVTDKTSVQLINDERDQHKKVIINSEKVAIVNNGSAKRTGNVTTPDETNEFNTSCKPGEMKEIYLNPDEGIIQLNGHEFEEQIINFNSDKSNVSLIAKEEEFETKHHKITAESEVDEKFDEIKRTGLNEDELQVNLSNGYKSNELFVTNADNDIFDICDDKMDTEVNNVPVYSEEIHKINIYDNVINVQNENDLIPNTCSFEIEQKKMLNSHKGIISNSSLVDDAIIEDMFGNKKIDHTTYNKRTDKQNTFHPISKIHTNNTSVENKDDLKSFEFHDEIKNGISGKSDEIDSHMHTMAGIANGHVINEHITYSTHGDIIEMDEDVKLGSACNSNMIDVIYEQNNVENTNSIKLNKTSPDLDKSQNSNRSHKFNESLQEFCLKLQLDFKKEEPSIIIPPEEIIEVPCEQTILSQNSDSLGYIFISLENDVDNQEKDVEPQPENKELKKSYLSAAFRSIAMALGGKYVDSKPSACADDIVSSDNEMKTVSIPKEKISKNKLFNIFNHRTSTLQTNNAFPLLAAGLLDGRVEIDIPEENTNVNLVKQEGKANVTLEKEEENTNVTLKKQEEKTNVTLKKQEEKVSCQIQYSNQSDKRTPVKVIPSYFNIDKTQDTLPGYIPDSPLSSDDQCHCSSASTKRKRFNNKQFKKGLSLESSGFDEDATKLKSPEVHNCTCINCDHFNSFKNSLNIPTHIKETDIAKELGNLVNDTKTHTESDERCVCGKIDSNRYGFITHSHFEYVIQQLTRVRAEINTHFDIQAQREGELKLLLNNQVNEMKQLMTSEYIGWVMREMESLKHQLKEKDNEIQALREETKSH